MASAREFLWIALFGVATSAPSLLTQSRAKSTSFVRVPGANVVTVVVHDYAFDMPASIPEGLTTFVLRNEGTQAHHLQLARIDAGKSMADVHDALLSNKAEPDWMHAVGGPNSPMPGSETNGTLNLEPGSYVAYCTVPASDGIRHFAKGMMKSVTVTPSTRARAALPASDISVTLSDYSFTLSRAPTAGHHVVAVTNTGSQPHELIMSQLAPGKHVTDFDHWIDAPGGKPPVRPFGGTTDISPGETMLIQVDFVPGRYSLLCRVRDMHDGKPHSKRGMMKEFVVD
jgi:uncharacterized cupredoxin-like copper-binding protein